MYTAGAQQTQIIGYRGAMGHAPENTVLSVQKALALDVDGIEIDVFRCQSGEIVVFHDKKLNKLTNGKGRIEQKSLRLTLSCAKSAFVALILPHHSLA